MPSATAQAISLARGPLIGTFLGLVLYGVTCMQAFFYFRTYEHDSWTLKMTVALLVVLETTHAAMSMWVMDDYLIAHYANLSILTSANWSFTTTLVLGLLIDFYVYLYFTWRIWLFTNNTWIVVLMSLLSVSRTVISITAAIISVLKPTWTDYLNSSRTLLIVGNLLFIAGDTFSASTMAFYLTKFKSWTHKAPGHPRRIDHLLNRLLVFAVATGALTSVVDVIALILTLSQPESLSFLGAILVQTRLYANSLLMSLNIRNATSRAYDDAPSTPVELPVASLRFAGPPNLSIAEDEGVREREHDGHAYKSVVNSFQTTQV